MSESLDHAGTRRCPSCGTENWPAARFCAECGTRLVDEEALARDFESTVADVIDEPEETSPDQQPVASTVDAASASEVTLPAITAVSRQAEEPPQLASEWPATFAQPQRSSGKTWMWILIGILAFIVACCCGLGLLVAVASSNDTGLQQKLTLLAAL